ncbi:MAG: phospholipase D-like domain-containing protein [Anaerolineales bacterium]
MRVHQQGVTVRVVVESDRAEEAEIEGLRSAGIPVVGDQRRGLMHQKFVIIDQRDVWKGSMNFTLRGVYRNDNHLIHFRSPSLVKNYTVEFMEKFEDQLFGDRIRDNTPHPKLEIQGVIDTSQPYSELGGEWEQFKKNGVDVRMDGNLEKMHHKFILIDGKSSLWARTISRRALKRSMMRMC